MLIKQDMLFTPVGKNRPLHLWLPDCYEQSSDRYPVMYFFDGHNLFKDEDATYGKSWGLCEFLRSWKKQIIIVGIECGHEGYERLYEYCPYTYRSEDKGPFHGIGDKTMQFMTEDLKPMIDQNFRTFSSRDATAIGGSSMGGLMSLYAAVKYNTFYSKAACVSSAIMPFMDEICGDIMDSPISADTRIFLSWGTEESGGMKQNPLEDYETPNAINNLKVAQEIQKKGALTHIICQRGGKHCEADWEKLVPDFMNFLWVS